MTDQSVFTSKDEPGLPTQQPDQSNPFADQLADIKKEDGTQKYDSMDKALGALKHSQEYIPQLKSSLEEREQEIAKLRAELDQRQSVEDVVSRLTPQAPEPEPQTVDQQGVLTAEQVEQLVQSKLDSTSQLAQAQSNVQQVSKSLSAKYGDKAMEVVSAKAKEIGSTVQELERLSSQNPNMVLALFNTQPSGYVSSSSGSQVPPITAPTPDSLERPTRSLLAGATSAQQKEYWNKVKQYQYAKLGVKE